MRVLVIRSREFSSAKRARDDEQTMTAEYTRISDRPAFSAQHQNHDFRHPGHPHPSLRGPHRTLPTHRLPHSNNGKRTRLANVEEVLRVRRPPRGTNQIHRFTSTRCAAAETFPLDISIPFQPYRSGPTQAGLGDVLAGNIGRQG
jgi:hypothetical protein